MNLIDWLKAITARAHDDEPRTIPPRKVMGTAVSRRNAHAGKAYRQEWVRVLDDSQVGRDPFNTYTWELDTGSGLPREPMAPVQPQPGRDPEDTYTWELGPGEPAAASDPWGLADAERKKSQGGVNPYDTGVFTAGWDDRTRIR